MSRGVPVAPGLVLLGLLLLGACRSNSNTATAQHTDSTTRSFGDSVPISNGLLGRVYLLPDTTHWLPDFDTLTPVDNPIYANEINIPWQKWSSGFPGLRDRVEWFGIEYTGSFKPAKAGKYIFKLISDDGSKLFIDGKKVIDNDGIHMEWAGRDTIYLSDSSHTIKLDYFQGPRYELALQLYWNQPDSPARIFPGKDFILYPPKPPSYWWLWLLGALALIAIFFLLRKKFQKNNTPAAPGPIVSRRTIILVTFLVLQCAALPGRGQDSDSSFLSLSLSASRIITGSVVTISGMSIKYGTMKDVEMTVKGNAGTETKTIPLTDSGHFKTTWGTGMAGEYQITIKSSNRKSSKTATVKVFRLMSMDSVVQKNKDETQKAKDQLTKWIDQLKPKCAPSDVTALQKKYDDLAGRINRTQQFFDDLAALGKALDKLQQAQGGLGTTSTGGGGGGNTGNGGGGGNGGGASGNMSPQLADDFSKLTDALSTQASNMETLNKAAAHQPYDNTICEYLQMVSEVCAAFSTFTYFFNPSGAVSTNIAEIGKNIAIDKGSSLAVGYGAPNANQTTSDAAKEATKFSATTVLDCKSLSESMPKIGFAGDIVSICTSYIMSKYCGTLSGDMGEDYKCTFRNADNAKWWEYTYHNQATLKLRYLKSAATSTQIKMKGNIEGNATKFTIFQKVSEMDDFRKAMKGRAQIFSICLWVPPTVPFATSKIDSATNFGAIARGVVTPAYFNIPIDADYNPETGQMKIYCNEAIVDYSTEVEYTFGYICIAAMIPLTARVNFPINKAKLTIAKVIEKNNDFQVKADANGKLSFTKAAEWTNGPEGSIVHIIKVTMSAKSD